MKIIEKFKKLIDSNWKENYVNSSLNLTDVEKRIKNIDIIEQEQALRVLRYFKI